MAETTSDQCVCRAQELPALVAAWRDRIQPVLSHHVNNGRAIDQAKLLLSAKLVVGVSKDDAAAFDERYRALSHHLPECPFACAVDETALALLS
jgi:hypothetical protein